MTDPGDDRMPRFAPQFAGFETDLRESFGRAGVLAAIGARVGPIAPGRVVVELPFREDLTQQNGYLHAGIVTTVVDAACGAAAYTLMPEGSAVLTVEFKVNFLAPAVGETLIAVGRVLKPGRTLTVCAGDGYMRDRDQETLVAAMQATMMTIPRQRQG